MFIFVSFGFDGYMPPRLFNTNVTCNILSDSIKKQCMKDVEDFVKSKSDELNSRLKEVNASLASIGYAEVGPADGSPHANTQKIELEAMRSLFSRQLDVLQSGLHTFSGIEGSNIELFDQTAAPPVPAPAAKGAPPAQPPIGAMFGLAAGIESGPGWGAVVANTKLRGKKKYLLTRLPPVGATNPDGSPQQPTSLLFKLPEPEPVVVEEAKAPEPAVAPAKAGGKKK